MASNDQMKVNPQGIRMAANRIKQAGQDYDEMFSLITKTIEALSQDWQGKAQKALYDAFQEHQQTLKSIRDLIADYENELNNYVADVEARDSELSHRHQG